MQKRGKQLEIHDTRYERADRFYGNEIYLNHSGWTRVIGKPARDMSQVKDLRSGQIHREENPFALRYLPTINDQLNGEQLEIYVQRDWRMIEAGTIDRWIVDRERTKERERRRERESGKEVHGGAREGSKGLEWGQFVTRPPVEAAGSYFLFAVCAYLPTTYTYYYVSRRRTAARWPRSRLEPKLRCSRSSLFLFLLHV